MAKSIQKITPAQQWAVSRMHFPAGNYIHPASGFLALRVVRHGSSYADVDLGSGIRRVYTRPGDVLLSLPDHDTVFRIEEGRELSVLEIRPKLALRLLRAAGGKRLEDLAPLAVRPVRDPFVAELCRKLEESGPHHAVSNWALGLVLASLLEHAARLQARQRKQAGVPPLRLPELVARIDRNLETTLSVDQLAAEAGLPRRAFARAFREATGLPTHQFILRRRVDHAAHLLATTKLSLAEVAAHAGFAHQAHMGRMLLRLKGVTPGQLRRKRAS